MFESKPTSTYLFFLPHHHLVTTLLFTIKLPHKTCFRHIFTTFLSYITFIFHSLNSSTNHTISQAPPFHHLNRDQPSYRYSLPQQNRRVHNSHDFISLPPQFTLELQRCLGNLSSRVITSFILFDVFTPQFLILNRRINTYIAVFESLHIITRISYRIMSNVIQNKFTDLQANQLNEFSNVCQINGRKILKSSLQASVLLIYVSRSLTWCARLIFFYYFSITF